MTSVGKLNRKDSNGAVGAMARGKILIISPRKLDRGLYVYQTRVHERTARSPRGFMRYENEDGRNKSDVGGSSESFLKAPRVTRQVYAETSIIPVTYFIASWANSGSPTRRIPLSPIPLYPTSSTRSRTISPSLGSSTFLFLIDSSSVLYELFFSPWWLFLFAKFTRIKKYSSQCSRFNISALRAQLHRVTSEKASFTSHRFFSRDQHSICRHISFDNLHDFEPIQIWFVHTDDIRRKRKCGMREYIQEQCMEL